MEFTLKGSSIEYLEYAIAPISLSGVWNSFCSGVHSFCSGVSSFFQGVHDGLISTQ